MVANQTTEFYVSDLVNNPVLNKAREKIGRVKDLVVSDINKRRPKITGLILKRAGKPDVFIPEHDFAQISKNQITLSTDLVDLTPFKQRENELLLTKDILDKQIVDVDDRRLTRINDLLLEAAERIIFIKAVEISIIGVLKRLGIPTTGKFIKHNLVEWEDVQFLGSDLPVKFNLQYHNLESLHPVDIARIIFEGPGYKQGSKLISALKDPLAADIIEELSPQLQQNLVESMKIEDVADVVNHMPAHKASDLLLTMGPAFAQKILPLLKIKHAGKINELLKYPESSVGAFMTTDYLAVARNISIDELYSQIQDLKNLPDFSLYVYVIESELNNKLVGVLSIYELYSADRRSRIEQIINKNPITITAHVPLEEALKKMYRYNLSALPVVSRKEGRLLGIITFRDTVSHYLPKRWKTRIHQILYNNSL